MITSRHNPRIKAAAALHRRAERRRTGRHLVEGRRAVADALAAGVVETVFAEPGAADDLATGEAAVEPVAAHVLARLADTASPQGVVAVARTPRIALDDLPADGLWVVADGLADPGNLGTVIRTAHAAGAAAVVTTAGTVDPFGPKAQRAAMGSAHRLPVVVGVSRAALRAAADRHGRMLLGLDAAGATSVLAQDPRGRLGLVLGSEAHGLDDDMRAQLDRVVAVPMPGGAESLNVAAAAAVAIYAVSAAARSAGPDGR